MFPIGIGGISITCRPAGKQERVPFDPPFVSVPASEDGGARVTPVPPGRYKGYVSASGYEATHEDSVTVEPGKETSIEVRLQPKEA